MDVYLRSRHLRWAGFEHVLSFRAGCHSIHYWCFMIAHNAHDSLLAWLKWYVLQEEVAPSILIARHDFPMLPLLEVK